jgi:hypothetical protein
MDRSLEQADDLTMRNIKVFIELVSLAKEEEVIRMDNEKKKKKGLFSVIRESMTKTGGCCGPGETCGGPVTENDKTATENAKGSDKTGKK